jgi:hypothetical protein
VEFRRDCDDARVSGDDALPRCETNMTQASSVSPSWLTAAATARASGSTSPWAIDQPWSLAVEPSTASRTARDCISNNPVITTASRTP